MEKKYSDFIDEISADELYEGLLGYGMFANKLPPVFTSESFLSFCETALPSYSKTDWHDYVSYSSMRNTNTPRLFGIPTPMKYQILCAIIRDNWDVIKKHFHAQTDSQAYRVSRIHIRKMYGKKELFEMNYKNWRVDGNPETELLLHSVAGVSKYVVKADISTCFPSMYSHSLPWALVGKDVAKSTCKKDSLWYNKLDSACACLKNGETHGLLIGPYASNLLSEIILTVVDKKLYDKGYRYFRNIDDYECYVDSLEKGQCFLRDLEGALREFDLPLNHKKTAISSLPIGIAEKWVHKLNNSLDPTKVITYKDTNAYLDLALSLADKNANAAVLKYAVKSLAGCEMTDSAKALAAQRVMHMAIIYPYLIQMMEDYVLDPFAVDKERIKVFSDAVYSDSLKLHNFEGISYAIFLSLKHDFILKCLDVEWVIKRSDCVMLLLTWLYYKKNKHGRKKCPELDLLKSEAIRLRNTEMDRYWLFCYEALGCNDLSGEWKQLKRARVSFIKSEYKFK